MTIRKSGHGYGTIQAGGKVPHRSEEPAISKERAGDEGYTQRIVYNNTWYLSRISLRLYNSPRPSQPPSPVDMRGPQVLALIKAFAAHIPDAIDPFSRDSSQSEDEAHLLSPFDSPSVPILDRDLQYEHYPEAVRHLRPSFPPTCAFVEPDDVKVVGDIPISAGGFADIWEGVIDGRSIFQKSYRCYEYCDIERIFQVRNELFAHTAYSHSIPEISRRSVGVHPALPPERCAVRWD